MNTSSPPRLLQLDLLRGVAILLVIGRHWVLQPHEAGHLEWVGDRWMHLGWTGVDLFFVLSGFLIGGLLFNELKSRNRIDLKRFLVRRAFKIWPAYLVYVAMVLAWMTYRSWDTDPLQGARELLPNFFHVQNYFGTPRSHTWSLAVEEHFYLALPLALHFLARGGENAVRVATRLAHAALVLIVLMPILRHVVNSLSDGARLAEHFYETHLRCDGLALGVLLAYFHYFHPRFRELIAPHRGKLLLMGAGLVSPMAFVGLEHSSLVASLGLSGLYVGYAMILVSVVYTPLGVGFLGRVLRTAPFRLVSFIGLYSYPIYLWHVDFGQTPTKLLVRSGWLESLEPTVQWIVVNCVYVAFAVAAGVVLGRLIERPALALRDRWFPARATALSQPESK